MTQSVDHALQEWAAQASDEDLDEGPTLDDLGGAALVLSEASTLATGPHLPYLVQATARSWRNLTEEQSAALCEAIIGGVRDPQAGWILADALEALLASAPLLERIGSRLARELPRHVEAALDTGTRAELTQPAVAALLRLALSEHANHHRLLALLTDITGDEHATALERLPLLIGVAHDHFGDTSLIDVLIRLENKANLPLATRADAGFELALALIRQALSSTSHTDAETLLRQARMRLITIDRTHENRLDARAYTAAIDAVLAFSELREPGNSAVEIRTQLDDAVSRLETITSQLDAWTARLHDLDWLSARGTTQSAWAHLTTTLRVASTRLAEPSWYRPSAALNDLLNVYLASRSIHTHLGVTADAPGALIAPTLETTFLRQDGLLHHLEQALQYDPDFTQHPDAHALYEAIAQRRLAMQQSRGDTVPGKALEGRPHLQALFQTGAALRDDLDPALLDGVDHYLERAQRGFIPTGNVTFDNHLADLLATLATSPAWQPPVAQQFTGVVEQFLRFMYDRFDAQADLYGERTSYLGPPVGTTSGGRPRLWPEKALQDDLHQHLSAALTPGSVQREIIDVASGRTDITYTPQPGNRYVIEVKRREHRCSPEQVEQAYLPQATNYTATGPPFAVLAVGDHSNHDGGYSDVRDRVWIAQNSRSRTELPRLIVIGVLPIGRKTPSDL
ncbi:hypothetical protein AB0K18_10395 [Nonomuraea sp. NPDC049421]|uniref:hypothetical protein n=1 Tax=Nonomuraea sp. NPDC049421 TaxID=3155275 RepID=UPI00341A8229